MKAVSIDVNCPFCSMTFTPFPSLSPAIVLKEENAKLKDALNKVFSLTHKWVVTKDNAEEVLNIVKPIRQVCDEALKGRE